MTIKKLKTDYHPEVHIVNGKRVGLLLLHGWTSTPMHLDNLSSFLQRKGVWVRVPLLPGHGKSEEVLNEVFFEEWLKSAEQEIVEFTNYVDYLFIGGWSMGGNIACNLASKHKVDGVLSLATPIFIKNEKLIKLLLPVVGRFKTKVRKRTVGNKIIPESNPNSYRHLPLKSMKELFRLIEDTKRAIPNITSPVLLMQSNNDDWVHVKSLNYLAQHLNADINKKVMFVKEASHDLILSQENSDVYQQIFNFIVSCISKEVE